MIKNLFAIIIGLTITFGTLANDDNCNERSQAKGYWFYCVKETEDEAKEVRKELPPPPAHSEMMSMHPDDLSELQEKYLKEAVWKPQPQKVLAYYTIQDVIRRKSLGFTSVSQVVMLENPAMNAYGQYNKTNPGRNVRTKVRQEETSRRLQQFRKNYALVMFTQQTCPFCYTQRNILNHFSQRHGWNVREIDIRKYPNAAAKFNVTMTPVTIVISKDSEKWMPIAVGEEALPTLEDNAYRAVRYLKGETSPDQFLNMQYEMGGINDPSAQM